MFVGVLKLHLRIYNSFSLKEKRRVIKSLIERIKNKFNVAIAEIGENDTLRKAIIGISLVSNSKVAVDKQICSIFNFLESNPEIEIIDREVQIL